MITIMAIYINLITCNILNKKMFKFKAYLVVNLNFFFIIIESAFLDITFKVIFVIDCSVRLKDNISFYIYILHNINLKSY